MVKSLEGKTLGGVPQGFILNPVLFNIFINDLDTGLEGILSKFTDDTKLGGAVGSIEGREALQRDLSKSGNGAITNYMKFNSAMKRELGVLVDGKLNMSQQCPGSQEGQSCPGGIRLVEGGDCPTLLCTGAASS
ncbi:hypothetical protein BTVI_48686 [Pitangus sulphuratus]|nr:hypothetical protein BTVI_48686 [Pitangus sulphuratus]